jgi:16S rRNA (guanine966-N2)-methyltransferase
MRISGGSLRGRILAAPKGRDVRPTSDKVRQAVFNILLKYGLPEGAQVLDLCCGTGALGLEALSRGAAFATFIDKSAESLAACHRNIEALGLAAQARALRRDAHRPGPLPPGAAPAELLFLDPPYKLDIIPDALGALAQGWLAPGAVCVVECGSGGEAPAPPPGYEALDTRAYGASRILFLRFSGV